MSRKTTLSQSFLLFVKSIQDSRKDDEKLNVFDLIALYKASKGENQRETDCETLNKLIKEGLLVETESGYKLPKLYDEMSGTLSGTCRELVESPNDIQLTERQLAIYNTIKENGEVTAKSLSETLSGALSGTTRTIERDIHFLRVNGFIRKEGKNNKGVWIILKEYLGGAEG